MLTPFSLLLTPSCFGLPGRGDVDATGEGIGIESGGEGDGSIDGTVFFLHANGGHENIDEHESLVASQLDTFRRGDVKHRIIVLFYTPEVPLLWFRWRSGALSVR